MRAYVMINVQPRMVRQIVSTVSRLNGVQRADPCWGIPDIIAYVEALDGKVLNELVIEEIQKIEGVERTETHVVAE